MSFESFHKQGCYCKKATNSSHLCFTHFHPAAQKIWTICRVLRWAPKISITNPASDQMWDMVTISTSVAEWRPDICRTLSCHSVADFWPFIYKMQLNPLKQSCDFFFHNYCMNFPVLVKLCFVMSLWPPNSYQLIESKWTCKSVINSPCGDTNFMAITPIVLDILLLEGLEHVKGIVHPNIKKDSLVTSNEQYGGIL